MFRGLMSAVGHDGSPPAQSSVDLPVSLLRLPSLTAAGQGQQRASIVCRFKVMPGSVWGPWQSAHRLWLQL